MGFILNQIALLQAVNIIFFFPGKQTLEGSTLIYWSVTECLYFGWVALFTQLSCPCQSYPWIASEVWHSDSFTLFSTSPEPEFSFMDSRSMLVVRLFLRSWEKIVQAKTISFSSYHRLICSKNFRMAKHPSLELTYTTITRNMSPLNSGKKKKKTKKKKVFMGTRGQKRWSML